MPGSDDAGWLRVDLARTGAEADLFEQQADRVSLAIEAGGWTSDLMVAGAFVRAVAPSLVAI